MDIYSIHTYIHTLNSNAHYIEPKSCFLATVYGNYHPHHHRRICLKGHALHLQMQDSIDTVDFFGMFCFCMLLTVSSAISSIMLPPDTNEFFRLVKVGLMCGFFV